MELIALPLPGEVLMSYAGYLVFQGQFNWILSILIAGVGSCIGMTISYWVGYKLGQPFFKKYGYRFHLGPERYKKLSYWFSKYGAKLLLIAYFIPGIRHVTGYFSGATRLPYRTYAIFAYIGAFIWVSVFISLGKLLGPQWETFHSSIKRYLIIGGIAAAFILIAIYIYKKYHLEIKQKIIEYLNLVLTIFHTRRRVVLLITITSFLSLVLSIFMFGLIQDYLGNEFTTFNTATRILIQSVFNNDWTQIMQAFLLLGSREIQFFIIGVTFILILWKSEKKTLELLSLIIVILGGEIYEEILRRVFQNLSPISYSFTEHLFSNFPSEQSLMNFVIYGFAVLIVVRSLKPVYYRTIIPIITLLFFNVHCH
ncbi:VTT domain-containing protein [Chungangia koreensis]|uniref:VTT domain-containing protein n=1 Tax=Chungangia koreensis TaxID=752657 RepID=UPI003670AA9B